jgi:hypothetical protein
MLDQHVLHVDRRYPQPTDLEHVVDTAHVAVRSIGGALVAIARGKPLAEHRELGLLVLVPVVRRTGVSAHLHRADRGPIERHPVVVDDP